MPVDQVEADASEWDFRNVDDLLAYETPKVVVIRDRRLGCLYYFIVTLIATYVGVFQIMYCNEHFPKKAVTGTSRLIVQQPTKANCMPDNPECKSEFKSLEQLEYCKEFVGETKLNPSYQKPCVYADQHSIAPNGMLEEHILVPTIVESEVQNKGCEPSPGNGHKCDNEYTGSGTKDKVFVADIEDYMLHISHTFTRMSDSGANTDVQGYYLECDKSGEAGGLDMERTVYGTGDLKCDGKVLRKPVECLHKDCPFLDNPETMYDKVGEVETMTQSMSLFQPSSWIRHGRRAAAALLSKAASKLRGDEDDVEQAKDSKSTDDAQHNHRRGHHHQHQHHRQHNSQRRKLAINADGQFLPDDKARLVRSEGGVNNTHPDSAVLKQSKQDAVPEPAVNEDAAPWTDEASATPLSSKMKEGVWALPNSDVFTVSKLLELCDLDMDSTKNSDGKSLREAGTVITIEAVYSNLHPWTSCVGNVGVEYEYRVTRRPVSDFGDEVYSQYQPNFPAQRILEQRHGIYVIVKIGGQFGSFSPSYLFVLIATSLGLMVVAQKVVDKVSMWFMKMKETYYSAKYQYTERVWDMQKDLDALNNLNFDALDEPDEAAGTASTGADEGAGGARAAGASSSSAAGARTEADF